MASFVVVGKQFLLLFPSAMRPAGGDGAGGLSHFRGARWTGQSYCRRHGMQTQTSLDHVPGHGAELIRASGQRYLDGGECGSREEEKKTFPVDQ